MEVKTSGYSEAGASHVKRALKAFVADSISPREDIDFNNYTLRQRGRMLYMSSPMAAAAINTMRTKGIGTGLHCKPSINYKLLGISEDAAYKWQQKTEAEFKMWAESKNCDALGLSNFYELEQLAMMSWLMSGDTFVLLKRAERKPFMPYTLRLQLIEADRICTPGLSPYYTNGENESTGNKIYDGVEVDASGRIVAYHICNQYPRQFDIKEEIKWTRVEAVGEKTGIPNILQIMNAERPEQYRGVTFLAPIIEVVLQERRYTEAELTAAIIQTYLTAWIVSESLSGNGNPLADDDDEGSSEDEAIMGPGNIIRLNRNEDVKFGNPNIPVAGFEDFIKTLNKQMGAALEIPYDVLVKEFNSSYSAAKGALEEASESIKMRRSWFVSDFCQPIYEIWLTEAVATGRISAPGFLSNPIIKKAYSTARWDGPAQTHLDPVKEAKANEIIVGHGWKTNEQVTRQYYGGDWSENIENLKNEQKRFGKEETDEE